MLVGRVGGVDAGGDDLIEVIGDDESDAVATWPAFNVTVADPALPLTVPVALAGR